MVIFKKILIQHINQLTSAITEHINVLDNVEEPWLGEYLFSSVPSDFYRACRCSLLLHGFSRLQKMPVVFKLSLDGQHHSHNECY